MEKSVLAAILAAVLGVVLLGALLLRPSPGPYTYARLDRLPEAHLYPPGAAVISAVGHDAERTIFASNPASAGYFLWTPAPPADIMAFYARELAARGWQVSPRDNVLGTAEREATTWRKGDPLLRVAIQKSGDPRVPAPSTAGKDATVFRLDLSPVDEAAGRHRAGDDSGSAVAWQ